MGSTPRGRAVVSLVERAGVLDALRDYDPVVVGTFPLDLDRPGSDVDVLCHAPDLAEFLDAAEAAFGDRPGFRSHHRAASGQPAAAVVRFEIEGVPVELFAQPLPTAEQQGFRHFLVEQRLLALGGEPFADRVRRARRADESVESAFARVLDLDGDPFLAVLDLEEETDDQLLARILEA